MGRTVRLASITIISILALFALFVFSFDISAAAEDSSIDLYLSGGSIDGYEADETGKITIPVTAEYELPTATKQGYSFLGWTKTLDEDDADYVTSVNTETIQNLSVLYAKYELSKPTLVGRLDDYDAYFDENAFCVLTVEITHELINSAKIVYSWYKNGVKIENADDKTITLKSVADSGEYACKIAFSIDGETVETESNTAFVTIRKAPIGELPTVILEGTYDPQKTLADYDLPEFYKWVDDTVCPEVTIRTYRAIYDKGNDYEERYVTITLILQKATQTITVENVSVVYDGNAHSVVASATDGEITYSENNSLTSVGKETIIITAEETENYTSATIVAFLEVKPQTVRVIWGGTTFVYDGLSHAPDYECVDAQNVALSLIVEGGRTNAGEYVATASLDNDNYILSDSSINFVIQKQSVRVVWGNTTFVYDGLSHAPDYECVDAQNVALSLIVEGGRTNAGEYVAAASIDNDNYILSDSSVDFVIQKATIDETSILFEDKTVVYDGNAHSIVVNGLPDFLSVEYDGEYVEAGIYTITARFTLLNDNYNAINEKQATLTVLQNRFATDWYEIDCPSGINPTVTVMLEPIENLDGITRKNNSKISCVFGFRIVFSEEIGYDKPIVVKLKLDNVDIDTLVLSVDDQLNETIITYTYKNGFVELELNDYSTNYVIGKRTHSIWWIVPTVIAFCAITCGVTFALTKKQNRNEQKTK